MRLQFFLLFLQNFQKRTQVVFFYNYPCNAFIAKIKNEGILNDVTATTGEKHNEFIEISKNRREELENLQTYHKYRSKIKDIQYMDSLYPSMVKEDSDMTYGDLPF